MKRFTYFVILCLLCICAIGAHAESDVNGTMSVFNSNEYKLNSPDELVPGEYKVRVTLENNSLNDVVVDKAYLAVKEDGRLLCLYDEQYAGVPYSGGSFELTAGNIANGRYTITIPENVVGPISIEAYFWKNSMAPIVVKTSLEQTKVYDKASPFSVFVSSDVVYDKVLGKDIDVINAYVSGEEHPVKIKVDGRYADITSMDNLVSNDGTKVVTSTQKLSALKTGDVFTYEVNEDGYITNIKVLYNGVVNESGDCYDDGEAFLKNAVKVTYNTDPRGYSALFANNLHPIKQWIEDQNTDGKDRVELVYGPCVDKWDNGFTLANILSGAENVGFDEDGYYLDLYQAETSGSYSWDPNNINVITYDYSVQSEGSRLSNSTITPLRPSRNCKIDDEFVWFADNDGINEEYQVNFAIARVVNFKVVDVLFIIKDY